MFCSIRCFNNINVTKYNCKFTNRRIGIIICDHQARDLLSCVDVAMILSNCKIIAQGTPKELINNPIAQTPTLENHLR